MSGFERIDSPGHIVWMPEDWLMQEGYDESLFLAAPILFLLPSSKVAYGNEEWYRKGNPKKIGTGLYVVLHHNIK